MASLAPERGVVSSRGWRRFFLLLGLWIGAVIVADLLPLGGWSDVRSQWLNAVVTVGICILFLVLAAYYYWKSKAISGLQASILCLIFGCMLVAAGQQLYTDILFLQQLGNRHTSANLEVPNTH